MEKNTDKIVIANWKMKLTLAQSLKLAKAMKSKFKNFKQGTVALCPNFLALREVGEVIKGSPLQLGAQNVFWEEYGAYTGEISANMLVDAGCRYVVVGHSERREYQLENYEMIHKKIKAVLDADGLVPIVCIGENTNERKTDRRDFILVHQLQQALGGVNLLEGERVIIAYEPIWAIGSGVAIEPAEAEYAHKIIKLTLNDLFGPQLAAKNFRIVYGGSISSKNVKGFVDLENTDGLLVGGASLDAEEFYKVAKEMIK